MTPPPPSTNSDENAGLDESNFVLFGENEAVEEEFEEEEEQQGEEEEDEADEDVDEDDPEEIEEEIVEEIRIGEEEEEEYFGDVIRDEDNGVAEMDVSNSPMSGDANEKDLRASMETDGHQRLMRSDSSNPHESEFHGSSINSADGNNNGAIKVPCSVFKSLRNNKEPLPEVTKGLESSKFLITTQNEGRHEGYAVNKKNSESQSEENNSIGLDKFNHGSNHLGSSEILEAKATSLSTLTRKRVAVSDHHFYETNDLLDLDEDVQQLANQPTHDNGPIAPRLVTTENKRPAAICDFFAKGWCVRGNLCRFIHIEDHAGGSGQQKEERVSPWQDGDSHRQRQFSENRVTPGILSDSQHSQSSKFDPGLVSSFNEVGNRNLTTGCSMFNDKLSLDSRLSYSFLSDSYLDIRKLPMEKDYGTSTSASLLQNSLPFSVSESDNFSLMNPSYHSFDWKNQVLSYDWEPSVPFRPSFVISPLTTSSPGRQYDPLRDSIELPRIGNDPWHQGTSIISNFLPCLASDSMVCKTLGSKREDEASSLSSNYKNMENKIEKASHKHGKDSLVVEAEQLGSSSVVDDHNGSVPGDTDVTRPLDGRQITETKITDTSDSRHQGISSSSKKGLKSDGHIQNSEGKIRKESKATRYFRIAIVDLVKELLKPTWLEHRLSKDAHNMIVKKATDKVISTLQPHQIPATTDSIKQYLTLSGSKIEKLVQGYVDKCGKS